MLKDIKQHIPEPYHLTRTIRETERTCVCEVRDDSGTPYIYRAFAGDGGVYRRLKELDAPHLPAIYSVEEEDGYTFEIEEYVQGDTLAFLLAAAPLKQEQIVSIVSQLCETLNVLHGAGIVHRDIKPENILLRGSETVLIDFDASRLYKPEQDTDTRVMGTTGYAAPEQYGFTQTDARSDIYSLGVLMNEALTRCHPSQKLADGPLRPIIEKCIEVNVDKRYASAVELRSALKASGYARSKRLAWTVAAITAAAVILAAILFLNRSRAPETVPADTLKGYTTEFSYDLDGDGKAEDYLFGVGADLPGVRPGTSDFTAIFDGYHEDRIMAPLVWRWTEENGYEPADEFAALLQDPRITLTAAAPAEGAQAPVSQKEDPFLDIWDGAIFVTYMEDNIGSWMFTAEATLDGEPLDAALVTQVELGE